jgi:hypothetical protein
MRTICRPHTDHTVFFSSFMTERRSGREIVNPKVRPDHPQVASYRRRRRRDAGEDPWPVKHERNQSRPDSSVGQANRRWVDFVGAGVVTYGDSFCDPFNTFFDGFFWVNPQNSNHCKIVDLVYYCWFLLIKSPVFGWSSWMEFMLGVVGIVVFWFSW